MKESIAILILENIWGDLNDEKSRQPSVLPFFEGLSRLNEHVQIYYMTFTNASSFDDALEHLLTAPQERLFIYVASHGSGARLGNINISNVSSTLGANVHASRNRDVEGVVFGSCEVGHGSSGLDLAAVTWKTGISWVLVYKNIMDWLPSTLIDLNFFSALMNVEREDLGNRDTIVSHAADALRLFNPKNKIAWSKSAYNNNHSPDISMSDAIRIFVKPKGTGNVVRDNTAEVLKLII